LANSHCSTTSTWGEPPATSSWSNRRLPARTNEWRLAPLRTAITRERTHDSNCSAVRCDCDVDCGQLSCISLARLFSDPDPFGTKTRAPLPRRPYAIASYYRRGIDVVELDTNLFQR